MARRGERGERKGEGREGREGKDKDGEERSKTRNNLEVRPYSRAVLLQCTVCFLPFSCQRKHERYVSNGTGG